MSNCLSIYNGSEPYIFVSYSHKDTQRVMPLIHGLQRRGFRVWYDNGIGGGSKFAMIIAEHLGKCHCMIAFLTPNYDASEYCRMEVTFSLDRKKAALPVYLEDFTPSDGLYFLLCTGHALYLSNYGGIDDFLDKLETAPLLQPCRYPVETFTPPTQPAVTPEQLAAKPVQPMQPPVQPMQPPVQPMQPPVQPTPPPVQPMQPPVQPMQPPMQPTQPQQPMRPPVQSQPVQPQQPVQPMGKPVQPSGGSASRPTGVNPFAGGRAYAAPSRSGSGSGAARFPRGSFDASGQQSAGGANRFPHGSFNAAGQPPASGAPSLPGNGTQQPNAGAQPQQSSNAGGQPQVSGANRFPHGSFNAGGQPQSSGVNRFPHGSFNAGTQQPAQSGSKLLEGLFGDLFGSGSKKK